MGKEIIEMLKNKKNDIARRRFVFSSKKTWYCILPSEQYKELIGYLFNAEGVVQHDGAYVRPCVKIYGFWVISADVNEPIFSCDI